LQLRLDYTFGILVLNELLKTNLMNIKKDNLDELNAVLTITVEKSDYEERVDHVLKDYRKKARIDGFRPGKVPQGLINKMYRKPVLVEEINKILGESLGKYLADEKLNILGEPLPSLDKPVQIDWDADAQFEFSFDIGMAPEMDFTVSENDKIDYYLIKTDEEEISKQRGRISSRYGSFKESADAISDNEMLKADLVELGPDNEPAKGIHVEEATISLEFVKDEESKNKFMGLKAGDVLDLDVKKAFVNETDLAALLKISKEKLAETGNNFRVTIKSVSHFEKAEINQELFDKMYGPDQVKSLDEFNAKITEELKAAFERNSNYKFRIDAKEYYLGQFKQDLPAAFLKRWLVYTNQGKMTMEQIEKDFDAFVIDLKWQLIKGKVARENELKIKEEELIAHTKDVFRQQFVQYYGIADVPDETLEKYAKESLGREEERNRYMESLMENKVFEFMQKTVKLDTKEVTLQEFNKMFEK
jgi:trigger factor